MINNQDSAPEVDELSAPSINLPAALAEAARLRTSHLVSAARFERMLEEIEEQALIPHGQRLLVRILDDGTIRFLIKEGESVCAMIDCGGGNGAREI